MSFLKSYIADSVAQGATPVQLDDLYEPPPVAFTFETIGWNVLAGVVVVGLFVWGLLSLRAYIKNRYRREAISKISQLQGDFNGVLVVLKQVAIYRFGREQVARLTGREWLEFLEDTAKDVQFLAHESKIKSYLYGQMELDAAIQDQLRSNAIKWIKTHA